MAAPSRRHQSAGGEIQQLVSRHYNSTVTHVEFAHSDLMIMRVKPDWGRLEYTPGQYTVLGLGSWEPYLVGNAVESNATDGAPNIIRRAYSICSRMIDENGSLDDHQAHDELEFYIALVRQTDKPQGLTPRLFLLQPGDRLHVGPRAHGVYTTQHLTPSDNVLFMATGTGEAPHNAMAADLLNRGHQGRIASAVCVRYAFDLPYQPTHRRLEALFPNYRYVPLTTREPWNTDRNHPNFVGRRYLQDALVSGELETTCGWRLDPANSHVYLCGNPAMITGSPATATSPNRSVSQTGMVELLQARGFAVDAPHHPGNLHFERYW